MIPVLAPEILAGMPTKQLLGRLRSLLQCEESAALSDRTPEEAAASEGILFKNTAEWQRAHADLKAVLAKRDSDVQRGDLEEAVSSFIDPLDPDLLALQELAAVLACSDRRYLPEHYNAADRKELLDRFSGLKQRLGRVDL